MEAFDVAIAGGGPAGAAAAITLAQLGRRVLLANRRPPSRVRIGEGLPPGSTSLLRDLGVLNEFLAHRHRMSFGNVSAWSSDEIHMEDFIHRTAENGYQLDRELFDEMLLAAAASAGADVRRDARIQPTREHQIHGTDPGLNIVTLDECRGRSVAHAKWLIDAGGRSSSLCLRMGGQRARLDRQVGFSLLLKPAFSGHLPMDQDGRTWVEAVELGWWYSVLLPSGHRLVAFLTDSDLPVCQQAGTAEGLVARLEDTKHLRKLCAMHGHHPCGRPQSSNASTARLLSAVGERWIAAGDAAQAFDPLSSQGISQALYTGMHAGMAVNAILEGDLGAGRTYDLHLRRIFSHYLAHRATVYQAQPRWAHSIFWQRRRTGLGDQQPSHSAVPW